jgi:acetylornithine deacetylase
LSISVNDCYNNQEILDTVSDCWNQSAFDAFNASSIPLHTDCKPELHGRTTYGSPTLSDQSVLSCQSEIRTQKPCGHTRQTNLYL